jgi:hypothetical protein
MLEQGLVNFFQAVTYLANKEIIATLYGQHILTNKDALIQAT